MRFGPLALKSSFALSNLGFDTNVFNDADPDLQQSDFTMTFTPTTNLWLRMGRTWLSGTIHADWVYYQRFASERSRNSTYRLEVSRTFNRLALTGSVNRLSTRERPGFEIDARSRRFERAFDGEATMRAFSKTHVGARAWRRRVEFDQEALFRNASLSAQLDRRISGTAFIVSQDPSIGGAASITANSGNITDSGTITVAAGGATFVTNANNGTIDLGTLAVTGGITLTTNDDAGADASATIVNATAFALGASTVDGNLSATANAGAITQSGALTVAGAGTFVTGGNDQVITLSTANAIAGEVDFTTNTAGGNTGNVTFDNGVLDVVFAASTIDGSLAVTSGAAAGITDNGTVTVANGATFTTDANSGVITMNQLALTGGSLTLDTNGTGTVTILNSVAPRTSCSRSISASQTLSPLPSGFTPSASYLMQESRWTRSLMGLCSTTALSILRPSGRPNAEQRSTPPT